MSVVGDLLEFLSEATTPFHAVEAMRARLISAGFVELKAVDSARLQTGQGYFLTRNDSSIIAFRAGGLAPENGVRLIGAHTDSPNLSIKPNPVKTRHGVVQLGVDVYGGALLNPWFDRDLSMAGRVNLVNASGDLESRLVDFKRPIAIIPSLAIHLDRDANSSRSINPRGIFCPCYTPWIHWLARRAPLILRHSSRSKSATNTPTWAMSVCSITKCLSMTVNHLVW